MSRKFSTELNRGVTGAAVFTVAAVVVTVEFADVSALLQPASNAATRAAEETATRKSGCKTDSNPYAIRSDVKHRTVDHVICTTDRAI